MSSEPQEKLVPKQKPDTWRDKYRWLVLAAVSLTEGAIYSTPYTPVPLEKEINAVFRYY